MVFRDRDMDPNGWAGAANGTLEERTYYCHNWRNDLVALISASGGQVQQVRYGEYGVSFGMPKGDTDGDGDCDSTDTSQIQTWITGGYDVRGDLDLDGDVDINDKNAAPTGTTLGWGVLSLSISTTNGGNRKGYAGYERDFVLVNEPHHVRNRVYNPVYGRWLTRDPLGYVDGMNLYEYVRSNAILYLDPQGTKVYPPSDKPPTELTPDFACPMQLPPSERTIMKCWLQYHVELDSGKVIICVKLCCATWKCSWKLPKGPDSKDYQWIPGGVQCGACLPLEPDQLRPDPRPRGPRRAFPWPWLLDPDDPYNLPKGMPVDDVVVSEVECLNCRLGRSW